MGPGLSIHSLLATRESGVKPSPFKSFFYLVFFSHIKTITMMIHSFFSFYKVLK